MDEVKQKIEATVEQSTSNFRPWWMELYCRNPRCNVGEITVHVKELASDPPFVRGPFCCPACREPVAVHWIRSNHEQAKREEHHARCLVNVQLYRRDHAVPGKLVMTPATVFADDTLPAEPYRKV